MKATFHPVISSIQKIAVYETKSKIFIIGSNNAETVFRVLKIDRTAAKDDLALEDDGVVYSKAQIAHYRAKIDAGRARSSSLKGICAFGILGVVKFLEGYYIILITKRRRIAIVGLHSVYKIEDTTMVYIPNDSTKGTHPDETRYLKMFVNIDLSSNFYYSYSYDITHTVQVNMAAPENFDLNTVTQISSSDLVEVGSANSLNTINPDFGRISPILKERSSLKSSDKADASKSNNLKVSDFVYQSEPNRKFVWNLHLISKLEGNIHPDWILFVIHGFICQSNISIFGRSVYLTLVARRSNKFAGTRFLKRGANFQGDVANEVETEQIVQDLGVTSICNPRICSFVQIRGSIPGHWSQDITKMVPKPTIAYDLSDPYVQTAGKHFEQLLKRYGSPIIVLNLVKQRENKKHESTLSEQFSSDIKYLNQFLSPQHAIQYVTFDMARKNKGKEATVMIRLGRIAQSAIEKTGIFCSHKNEVQTGVIRVNCVDCLDRTNTAQFALGKCALTFQLKALGLLSSASLEFDCDCTRLLEALYEDHGDTLALQYGGSQLVHRIKTYRKTAPWTSQGNDIMQTLSRYYSNTFSDQEKQHTINLFLGLFIPSEISTPIWELSTDYYMHNPASIGDSYKPRRPLTQWWSDEVMCCLPKPHSYLHKRACYIKPLEGAIPEWVDVYADFHKIHEFTPLPDISSFIMSHTVRDFMPHCVTNYSPFIVRVQPGRRREETAKGANVKNPSLTGQSSTSSTTSSASSSQESDEEETKMSDSRQSSPAKHSSAESNGMHTFRSLFPSMVATYGIGLTKPSKADSLLYKRYVLMSKAARRSLLRSSRPTRAYTIASIRKPITVFPPDSSYQATVPKVSPESKAIYTAYVSKHSNIDSYLTSAHAEKYARYINNQMYLFPAKPWEPHQ